MTSLKRPLDIELTQHLVPPTTAGPVTSAHKRRCTNFLVPQTKFGLDFDQQQNHNHYHQQQQQQQQQQHHQHHQQQQHQQQHQNQHQNHQQQPHRHQDHQQQQHQHHSQLVGYSNANTNNGNFNNSNNNNINNVNNASGSPFEDSSSILAPLTEDLPSLIKNEIRRTHDSHCHQGEPPILSERQTQMICERIIKEREHRLREEYDKILISKLAEQYETFVKYTRDHIERRFDESHQASYLS